jgi:hypothetical protein
VSQERRSITIKELENGLLRRATNYEQQKMDNLYKITKEVFFFDFQKIGKTQT